jgi:hypothetical protein
MGYEKRICTMRNRVRRNYNGMQLYHHINYYATRVQLQYGNTMN